MPVGRAIIQNIGVIQGKVFKTFYLMKTQLQKQLYDPFIETMDDFEKWYKIKP